jgi:hypothetical protein
MKMRNMLSQSLSSSPEILLFTAEPQRYPANAIFLVCAYMASDPQKKARLRSINVHILNGSTKQVLELIVSPQEALSRFDIFSEVMTCNTNGYGFSRERNIALYIISVQFIFNMPIFLVQMDPVPLFDSAVYMEHGRCISILEALEGLDQV